MFRSEVLQLHLFPFLKLLACKAKSMPASLLVFPSSSQVCHRHTTSNCYLFISKYPAFVFPFPGLLGVFLFRKILAFIIAPNRNVLPFVIPHLMKLMSYMHKVLIDA